MAYYKTCPWCGATLDPGEICTDCKKQREEDNRCQSLEICRDTDLVGSKLSVKRKDRRVVGPDGGVSVAVGTR